MGGDARCEVLLDTVRDYLSISTEAVLGSNCNVAKLAVGFACPCSEVDIPHLAVHSDAGNSLDCCVKYNPQRYIQRHCVWFSSVDGMVMSSS